MSGPPASEEGGASPSLEVGRAGTLAKGQPGHSLPVVRLVQLGLAVGEGGGGVGEGLTGAEFARFLRFPHQDFLLDAPILPPGKQ